MDAADRLSLVAAAATSLGPIEDPSTFAAKVRDRAVELYLMSRERGAVGRALEQLDECRTYVATVLGGKVEHHPLPDGGELRRGLVRLKVAASKYNRDGVEEIRTELLSTDEGAALWARIRGLVGHRVLVYAQTEEKDSRKVKTMRHVEDLGEDRELARGDAA
ncbi:hypothetical protein [Microlunatus ginsengisoli]|uniref:Uncharacterized protein n=1 Tax=Microlunatus ginsengisoli TaxID=363863 RepID=A0ABP7AL85_9ACTN